jgi:DNA-directed RNA polymerase subunit beta'
MAVHVPLSPEAQAEAREIMAAPKTSSSRVTASRLLQQNSSTFLLGSYWMTKEVEGCKGRGDGIPISKRRDLGLRLRRSRLPGKDQSAPIEKEKYAQFGGKLFETTVGRLLFNTVFPSDYPFINTQSTKRARPNSLTTSSPLRSREGSGDLDRIKNFGFRYVTQSGITWSLDDIRIPKEKNDIVAAAQKKSDEVFALAGGSPF